MRVAECDATRREGDRQGNVRERKACVLVPVLVPIQLPLGGGAARRCHLALARQLGLIATCR